MERSSQCAICGFSGGCGRLVMGQFICLDCQVLLDDPNKRVLGCANNRRFAKKNAGNMALARVKD